MTERHSDVVTRAYTIGSSEVPIQKADQTSESDPQDLDYIAQYSLRVIDPPYDPGFLAKVYEHANSLRQNVDAYKTNIDGFGHTFEPLIELRESGGREAVADAIMIERARTTQTAIDATTPPTEEEIDTRIKQISYQMRLEKAQLESFFDSCVAEESFVSLRRKTREDVEVTGNGYWEVIRNDAGVVSQFAHMPSRSVRVDKIKSELAQVQQLVRVGALSFRTETYRRRFRRYVQIGGSSPVYFKEYGDPSVVSGKTGKQYENVGALTAAEGAGAIAANEVIHFKIHSLKNAAYGVPRWIGNLLSVLGSRSAEEVNYAYFENKSIPPMAILVSGGRLGDESVRRIQDFVEVNIKGKKNFHRILVIEAETTAGSIGLQDNASHMRVEIKQLTDALLKDGIFLSYDAANMDKVGMGFRLPRLLRGDIRDFNRASAQAALEFAETQVFVPERSDFDFAMNRFVLPELGIKLWRFKSRGPRISSSQDWGDMITKLTTAGILTPQDSRELVGKNVLEAELPTVKADWVKQPLALTIAGVPLDNALDGIIPTSTGLEDPTITSPNPGVTPPRDLLEAAKSRLLAKAKGLLDLRNAFRALQEREAMVAYQKDRQVDLKAEEAPDALVIKMSAREMAEKLGIVPDETSDHTR